MLSCMLRSSSDVRYVLPVYLLLGGIVGLAPQSASECDDGKCCWEGERPPLNERILHT